VLKHVMFVLISTALLTGGLLPTVTAQEENGLPAPTGPYQVGATFRQWIDESREEPFTADPDDQRILSAWIYYPAVVDDSAERMPYIMDEAIVPVIKVFATDYYEQDYDATVAALRELESFAYRDAPVADDNAPFPVILITDPSGFPLQFSVQAVEYASQGYVVVQVLDCYGYELEFTETGIRTGDLEDTPGDWLMELSVIDIMAVLDRLDVLNAPDSGDSLADTLDLSRIGIVGSSIGGGVAREAALRDNRITAGVSLDGAFEPYAPTPLEQPFMYVYQYFEPGPFYQQSEVVAYRISFKDFRHGSFSDYLFWPGVQDHPAVRGRTVTSIRAHEVFTTYIVAFFDEYLKGDEQPLLDGESEDFPEVLTIESMNTD
jgi:dienelactone hydrolase